MANELKGQAQIRSFSSTDARFLDYTPWETDMCVCVCVCVCVCG